MLEKFEAMVIVKAGKIADVTRVLRAQRYSDRVTKILLLDRVVVIDCA